MRKWYMVVDDSRKLRSSILTRKSDALRLAKANNARVLAAPAITRADRCPGDMTTGYDYPTFRALSSVIYPAAQA